MVGMVCYTDVFTMKMVHFMGLINGVVEGRERGVEFLRLMERTKVLMYLLDGVSMDGRCAVEYSRFFGGD